MQTLQTPSATVRWALLAALVFIATVPTTSAQTSILPANRQTDWRLAGVPGGIPTNRTRLIDVTLPPYSADKTGVADAVPAITAAIAAAAPEDVVYLPAGTYRFDSPVNPKNNITIRGAGMGNTLIRYMAPWGSAFNVGSESDYLWNYPLTPMTAGLSAGSTTITVGSTSGFIVGGIIQITEKNSKSGDLPVVHVSGFDRVRRQMTRVLSINSATSLTIHPPLMWTFTPGLEPLVARASVQGQRVGIEDLAVDSSASTSPRPAIYFSQAYACWAKNVKVVRPYNYSIGLIDSLQCEIRGSYMDRNQGMGSNRAGFLVNTVASSLVEDNILYGIFPHIEVNMSSSGNVFGYNFCEDSTIRGVSGVSIDSNHGPHNSYNLYEGNVFPTFQSDGYFGSASHDVLFRNWIHGLQPAISNAGWHISLNRFTRHYSLIGNIIGSSKYPMTHAGFSSGNPNMGNSLYIGTASPLTGVWWKDWGTQPGPGGFQELDLDVSATTLRIGNYNFKDRAIPAAEALGSTVLPESLYLSGRPAWFETLAWPPFDPRLPGTLATTTPRIPAQARYLSSISAAVLPPPNLRVVSSP